MTGIAAGRPEEVRSGAAFDYSLLPREYARPRRVHPVPLSLLAALAVVAAGIGVAELALRADASRSRLAALEERRRAEAEEYGRLAAVRKDLLASVQPVLKETILHPPFSNVLISLSSCCGGAAWLEKADIDAIRGTCRLGGQASDASSARQVVERLRQEPLFASAALEAMDQASPAKGNGVSYEIVAELSGTSR